MLFQLGKGGWRKPLTMGNQTSETIEEFSNKPGLREKYDFDPRPQPFNLKSHHTNGPSKVSRMNGTSFFNPFIPVSAKTATSQVDFQV